MDIQIIPHPNGLRLIVNEEEVPDPANRGAWQSVSEILPTILLALSGEIAATQGMEQPQAPSLDSLDLCQKCRYYSGDRHLACAVRPGGPIDGICPDFDRGFEVTRELCAEEALNVDTSRIIGIVDTVDLDSSGKLAGIWKEAWEAGKDCRYKQCRGTEEWSSRLAEIATPYIKLRLENFSKRIDTESIKARTRFPERDA